MKKSSRSLLVVAIVMSIGLAACGEKKTAQDKVTEHLTKSGSIHALTADERQLAETNAKQFFNRSFPNGKDAAGELTTAKGMWLDCRPSDSNSNGLVTCHGILPKLSGGFDDKATRYCGYRPELVGCSDEDTVSSKR